MDPLARLAAEPAAAALLLDVDGVLAPIVARPTDARVPDATRAELRRLAARYGLVAAVTGRPSVEARRIVGVESVRYVGEHGLELDPAAAAWSAEIDELAGTVDWPDADTERKPFSLVFHFRQAADRDDARRRLDAVAEAAAARGLRARFGRMVLEVLPPVDASKGTTVRALLAESGLHRALYAGDDTTDLDAFAALAELELAVRVAVASAEAPRELTESADVLVESPEAFVQLLRRL